MELSDRKQKILQAIIDDYIDTAEPVGSRAISKKNELGLSSATIRNEMADLEDMGYLIQPHTSAGRIPSDVGYRFYVNSLMRRYQMSVETVEKLQEILTERVSQLETVIKKASLIASTLTEYTTVVTSPRLNSAVIKKIELVNLGLGNVMVVVITGTGIIKNQTVAIDVDDSTAARLTEVLNSRIAGLTAESLTLDKVKAIGDEIDGIVDAKTLINILNFVYEAIDSLDQTDVYVNNAQSILSYPEFSDVNKAKEMLTFLENKDKMIKLIGSPKDDVDVKIGAENEFAELSNSSLVAVNYKMGNRVVGRIGVIGPKRMDYAKVIASLDCISNNVDKILGQLYNSEGEG
ncbi:MAG: heat-inducible transcriptional repressor HrcA [Clostridiales bacterium]|nr:heat-inducible transcriptional repressor HrcA [Clostridiales bacterium]